MMKGNFIWNKDKSKVVFEQTNDGQFKLLPPSQPAAATERYVASFDPANPGQPVAAAIVTMDVDQKPVAVYSYRKSAPEDYYKLVQELIKFYKCTNTS
jgi:hypothetical protein